MAKNESQQHAWVQAWEESERGWGTRPDGCWYYETKEMAEADTARMANEMRKREADVHHGEVPDEYSRPCGAPLFIPVDQKLATEIRERSRAYRDNWPKLT